MFKPHPTLIKSLVQWHINIVEPLGDQVGGSGHLGHISLSHLILKETTETTAGFLVSFDYILQTESEFTIYPDNPPQEFFKSGTLLVTEQLIVKYESEKKISGKMSEDDDKRFLDSFRF